MANYKLKRKKIGNKTIIQTRIDVVAETVVRLNYYVTVQVVVQHSLSLIQQQQKMPSKIIHILTQNKS